MSKRKHFWLPGEMARLARAARITPSNLSSTLHRKRRVSVKRAHLLEEASGQVLPQAIPWHAWVLNATTPHPAFFGRPDKAPPRSLSPKRKVKTQGGANAR